MKKNIAKNIGFCRGVKRAFEMVEKLSKENAQKRKIFILGSLAHNDQVALKVKSWGIEEIKNLASVAKDDLVIITAHGAAKEVFGQIESKGAQVFNATCPKVIKTQKIAEYYAKKGMEVAIFGDPAHKEVKGINGWCNQQAIIISGIKEAKNIFSNFEFLNGKKGLVLVSQTTQNSEEFEKICNFFKKRIKNKDLLCFNTICNATFNRQNEIRQLAKNSDAVIIVGGKNSGNTKRLWEIASEINEKTFWINEFQGEEISAVKEKIKDLAVVSIASGASTPFWEILKIKNAI